MYGANGQKLRTIDTELPRNHLMALARDGSTGAVVAAASCDVAKSIAVVDVAAGTARAYGTAPRRRRGRRRRARGDRRRLTMN